MTAWLGTATETASLSAAGFCPLTGPAWGEGDILLGGQGSDTFTGRTGDEIIDGDKQLQVRISVRDASGTEIGTTDLMEHQYLHNGPALLPDGELNTTNFTGPTLQASVFAGTVDTGNLVNVREIITPTTTSPDCGTATPKNCDVFVYAGPRSQYVITPNAAAGTVTVRDTTTVTPAVAGVVAKGDGTDTLRGIEQLKFADQTVSIAAPGAPTIGTATLGARTATTGSATVTWTAPTVNATGITGYEIVVNSGGVPIQTITGIGVAVRSRNVTGLTFGTTVTFQVRALNQFGPGPLSAQSNPVTPVGLAGAPTAVTAVRADSSASLDWTAPVNNGGSAITGYQVLVRTGAVVVRTIVLTDPATSTVISGLTNGTAYNFRVQAVTAAGLGTLSAASNPVPPATTPGAPGILAPTQGAAGGALTAVANWAAPTSTGGAAIQGYRVSALRMAADGTTVVGAPTVAIVGAGARTRSFTLPAGSYRFEVIATNSVGDSVPSARSALVQPR